ncbi:hypothetical protein, partial [Bacillus mobilis]
ANRTSHRTRNIVAAVFRDMMLRVDLSGEPSFRDAVNRTRVAFYRGARHMDFDMLDFREEQVRSMVRRGSLYRNDCVLNFALTEEHLFPEGGAPEVSDGDWKRLLSHTSVETEVLEESEYFALTNLWTGVYPDGDRTFVFASAKQRFLDPEQVATLLRSLEGILVEAAREGDAGFGWTEQLVGVERRAPSGRWSFSDGSWVRHETIECVLSAHPSVLAAEVSSDHSGDVVTAHVTTDAPGLGPAGLRDFFLETVEDGHSALSPHRFSVTVEAPAASEARGAGAREGRAPDAGASARSADTASPVRPCRRPSPGRTAARERTWMRTTWWGEAGS